MNAGPRLLEPLHREQRRADEELEPDEGGDRVPREAEDERPAAHPECNWLSRPNRDPPEDLLDAQLGLGRADEVVDTHRDATARDQDVRLEPALDRSPGRFGVVLDRRQALDRRAGAADLGREDHAVRVVDLAALERLAGRAQLRPRHRQDDTWKAADAHRGDSCGGQRAQMHRAQANAGTDHRVAGAQVSAARPDIRAFDHARPGRPEPRRAPRRPRSGRPNRPRRAPRRRSRSPSPRRPRAPGVTGRPAATRATIGSVAGTSAARIAKPSIADAGNDGRSTSAAAASARTRPAASSSATSSAVEPLHTAEHELERLGNRQQFVHGAHLRRPKSA